MVMFQSIRKTFMAIALLFIDNNNDNNGHHVIAAEVNTGESIIAEEECDVAGTYIAQTGSGSFCDNGPIASGGRGFVDASGEVNTISLLNIVGSSQAWIRNEITVASNEFWEIEDCTRRDYYDDHASTGGLVYDCITMERSDTVPTTGANVISRYNFNEDCTSFTKLVQILPGGAKLEDGSYQRPSICKIVLNKQSSQGNGDYESDRDYHSNSNMHGIRGGVSDAITTV
mmetsp:Transcript_27798/g.45146  ORF Transcript_27798/g.45146 Transcript_27798/m.45146 type:complete len:229 (-) Transcript_27798:136-822(-)|eukprot:CAMPEP_0196144272 /NCGR_PEP_ID=MMETSP0910-20130528/15701_1 /TAXON_ID=49265 /ORGANISM="Thalassiosira rotula, Strain GSO102" /LENGTH=228 /DNA_ID=CAMNT_0041405883 /DNA_START=100 /DNA_END=786 /DNA_ORIENTATION=+